MADETFVDLAVKMTEHGCVDFYLDEETGDFATTKGFDSAFVISAFTDNRAEKSQVPAPVERRGWIGNEFCEIAGGYGSLLWLYVQSRLDGHYERNVYFAAIACMQWLVDGGFAVFVDVDTTRLPEDRGMKVVWIIGWLDGSESTFGWDIWRNTPSGSIR